MARRESQRACRAGCQRGRAVGNRQPLRPGVADVAAIQRFGRYPGEEPMLAETLQPHPVDGAPRGKHAVGVVAPPGMACAPVVDRPVARARVEREERIIHAHPCDVCHAADIHHRQRSRQIAHQRCMIDRHKWRALPASRDVGSTQIVYHPHAQRAGQPRPVADLPGEVLFRPVRDCLAVETDDVDRRQRNTALPRPGLHGRRVCLRHGALRDPGLIGSLLGAECPAYCPPLVVCIGHRKARPEGRHALAVGLDQRHIDTVDRRSTHQAKRAQVG